MLHVHSGLTLFLIEVTFQFWNLCSLTLSISYKTFCHCLLPGSHCSLESTSIAEGSAPSCPLLLSRWDQGAGDKLSMCFMDTWPLLLLLSEVGDMNGNYRDQPCLHIVELIEQVEKFKMWLGLNSQRQGVEWWFQGLGDVWGTWGVGWRVQTVSYKTSKVWWSMMITVNNIVL